MLCTLAKSFPTHYKIIRILKIITGTVYLKGHYRSTFYAYFIPIKSEVKVSKITEWYFRVS